MSDILHIATDEKFINNANWLFEKSFPDKNQFYILVPEKDSVLIHVKEGKNITKISQDTKSLKKLSSTVTTESTVVIHGLFYHSSVFVNSLNTGVKVIWMLYGKEYHENPKFKIQATLYGNKTKNHFRLNSFSNNISRFVKYYTRDLFYLYTKSTLGPFKEMYNASKKVNFIGILYREEFDEIAEVLENEDVNFLKFSYYPIEKMVNDINAKVKGHNILLGNSSNMTGNHLDALDILKSKGIGERKIICPLSYGDPKCAVLIGKYGVKLFNDNFVPLIDFMPLHEYNSYLEQCGIVIMNNYRQQAVGNIMTMLWMGAKVFLDKRNTTYTYLKRINVHIFSINTDLNNSDAFNLLTEEQISHNRSILISEIGYEKLQQNLENASDIFI